jgi:DMSO reductase anchor subunit
MRRTDSTPLRYIRDEQNAKPDPGVKGGQGVYRSAPLAKSGKAKLWSIDKLRSREDPLVIFTLITQAVVGAFAVLFLGPLLGLDSLRASAHPLAYPVTLFGLIALQTFALVISTLHLGRPHRFYRAFNNLRYSPVSREVAAVAVFYNLLGVYAVLSGVPQLFGWLPAGLVDFVRTASGWLAVIAGPVSLYFMHRIYRIKARPFWNHWQVLSSFFGSMLTLGPLLVALVFLPTLAYQGEHFATLMHWLALPMLAGLLLEGFGLWRHAHYLQHTVGEGDAAWQEQITRFGKTYRARNASLLVAALLIAAAALSGPVGGAGLALWTGIALLVTVTALVGRALFYVLVIPTTMPGAFFWKNPGFEEHAREVGLAGMSQVGVQASTH